MQTAERQGPRRPPVEGDDLARLGRVLLAWTVLPLIPWALGLLLGPRDARGLRRLMAGFRASAALGSWILPWGGLSLLGLAWYLRPGPDALRWSALLLGGVPLAWALLGLPAWTRMHLPEWKAPRPIWKAFLAAAAWPLTGDPGYWRALPPVAGSWLAAQAAAAVLGGLLAGLTGGAAGFPGWWLACCWLLLPLPLAAARRAAERWDLEMLEASRPAPKGRKGRPGKGVRRG